MNYPSLLLSLTGGTREPVTPHVSETRTEQAALRYWRGQSSPTARLPAVTSSRYDLLDLAHQLHHLSGPIVDASDDGGGHGDTARRDNSCMPATTLVAQIQAQTSIYELWWTYCAL